MLASKLHWRILTATIVALIALAFVGPKLIPAPAIQENRVLAPLPEKPQSWRDLSTFRAESDAYVADHFPVRPHLIGVLNRVRMLFGVTGSNRVLVGRDGWLFFDNDSHLGSTRNDPPLPAADIRSWLTGLAGRTEALKARGIAYVVVSPPMKDTVYPEKAPAWLRVSPDRPAELLPRLAREAGVGEVIYLHDAVMAAKAKGRKVYSRHDTHWTGYGAYAGYRALMSRLQLMGLTEGPVPISKMTTWEQHGGAMPRDLALMLGAASFVHLDFTHLLDLEASKRGKATFLTEKSDWTSPYVVDTGMTGKPVLLMTRDSFSTEMEPWLYNHFRRIIFAHDQDGFFREDLIDRFKPDLVILEVIEAGLPVVMSPAPPASPEALARIEKTLVANKIAPPAKAPPAVPSLKQTTPAHAALMDAATPSGCNLEIAKLERVMGSAELTVGGWISEVAPVNTSPWGMLRLKGPKADVSGPILVNRPRPDVAAYFKQPAAAASGFGDVFQIAKLPPGTYQPTVYRRTPTGWMACVGLVKVTAP